MANLVVRTYAPVRRIITLSALALLGAFALYGTYELGRFEGGYDRVSVSSERTMIEVEIERLEALNQDLRAKVAELETLRVGQSRERAEVSRTIGDLQAQLARHQQDLAFYRGIVTQSASGLGVKIQQVRIARTEEPQRFRVRLTLVQSARPDSSMTGVATFKVEGASPAGNAVHDLAALTGGKRAELSFNFRYFENLDQEIELPQGFTPERLTVDVRATRKGVTPLTQSFLWKVDPA